MVAGGQIRGFAGFVGFASLLVRPDARISARELLTVFGRWKGFGVAAGSIEVSGPDAERLAGELRAALAMAIEPGDSVSPVEVERSAELVIAIIGLMFNGVEAAKTIWGWWHDRRPEGVKVRILLDDGTRVDLSGADRRQLEIAFGRSTTAGH